MMSRLATSPILYKGLSKPMAYITIQRENSEHGAILFYI